MSTISKTIETISQVVDPITGEVVAYDKAQSTEIIKKTKDYDEFIQVYLNDLSGLLQLDSQAEIKLLTILWKEFPLLKPGEKESTMAILKADKERYAEQVGVSLDRINRLLRGFVKKKLLFCVSRSTYTLNAKYFFKGGLGDRLKVMNFQMKYEIEDPSI